MALSLTLIQCCHCKSFSYAIRFENHKTIWSLEKAWLFLQDKYGANTVCTALGPWFISIRIQKYKHWHLCWAIHDVRFSIFLGRNEFKHELMEVLLKCWLYSCSLYCIRYHYFILLHICAYINSVTMYNLFYTLN